MTYNVRRCLGTDGVLSPERIARVIAECDADIVALQELDVRRLRSGGVDQARVIGDCLGLGSVHFHPALQIEDELYGDAILTRAPSRLRKFGFLPEGGVLRRSEPRGALWVELELDGVPIQVVNTHFGLGRWERRAQAAALLSEDWLGHPDCRARCIFAGDLNSLPGGGVYRRFAAHMRDAQARAARRPAPTFPSWRPLLRIDHVFVSADIGIRQAGVWRSQEARVASDHLPLVAELELDGSAEAVSSDRQAVPVL
ncbi:endonuclease/exonuclease/phosphatase family protein [Bosea sp. (in: a-proteobacteria)]|uniref:endonuclease/exonuclease/phosphatase family protein n=1 Tax=Bosea sp. (in: a-proteobacteria) TaxID=1871050 RepID=UPI003F6F0371